MLFLDLDGTVIGRRNALSTPIKEALTKAREAGIKMAICTGRTSRGLSDEVAAVMSPSGPHIFESGAAIVRMDKHETLRNFPLPDDVALDIACVAMEISGEFDAAAEFYTEDGIFISKKTKDSIRHAEALKIDPDTVLEADVREIAKEHKVVRVQWVAHPDAFKVAIEETPKNTTVAIASSHSVRDCMFASVTRKGVDKGTAAKIVAEEMWGEKLEDCYGVGDSVGDVPFLEVVGHPFMMASASPDLLAKYPNLKDVEEDGVLAVIDAIMAKA